MARPKQRLSTNQSQWLKRVKSWEDMNGSDKVIDDGSPKEHEGDATDVERHEKWSEDDPEEHRGPGEAHIEGLMNPSAEDVEDPEPNSPTSNSKQPSSPHDSIREMHTDIRTPSWKEVAEDLSEKHEDQYSDKAQSVQGDEQCEASVFSCTACGKTVSIWEIVRHPQLYVGICWQCKSFLFSSPFSKDIDGSEDQCRWCGQGGDIILCDQCDKVFCQSCIKRNLGQQALDSIVNSEKWCCFFCNSKPLCDRTNEFKALEESVKLREIPEHGPDHVQSSGHRETVDRKFGWNCSYRARNVNPGNPHLKRKWRRMSDDPNDTIRQILARQLKESRQYNPAPKIPTVKAFRTAFKMTSNFHRKTQAHVVNREIEHLGGYTVQRKQQGCEETKHQPIPPARSYLRPHQFKARKELELKKRKELEAECSGKGIENAEEQCNPGTVLAQVAGKPKVEI